MKYKFSIYRTIATLFIILILLAPILIGGSVYRFINIPSFVVTFALCFFMLLAVYEVEFLKFIPHALKVSVCRPLEANPQFAQMAIFGSRAVIGAGIIGMIIRIIQMFSNLSSPECLGAGLAISFVCPFYAIVISEVFFAIVHQSFKNASGEEKDCSTLPFINAGLPFVLILFSICSFLVLALNYYI